MVDGPKLMIAVIEQTRLVHHLEGLVDTDEEPRWRVESFLRAKLNALDLARYRTELSSGEDFDLDPAVCPFFDLFLVEFRRSLLGSFDGYEPYFHDLSLGQAPACPRSKSYSGGQTHGGINVSRFVHHVSLLFSGRIVSFGAETTYLSKSKPVSTE